MSFKKLSILIPVYNEKKTVKTLLERVQNVPLPVERFLYPRQLDLRGLQVGFQLLDPIIALLQLVLGHVVLEEVGLEEQHRPFGVQILERGPATGAFGHYRQAGQLHMAAGEPP